MEGRIHGAWTDEVDTELLRASKQTNYLILDLEKLEFIASSGLRTFLKLRREQVGKNGNIVFARPTEVVRETFEVASFEHLFPIFESVKDAFEGLNLTD